MRRHAKLFIASTVGLFIAASATANVPNFTVELSETPSWTTEAQSDLNQWDAQRTLNKLGISIDLSDTQDQQIKKEARLGQNTILCLAHADSMCKFLEGKHGFDGWYNACHAHHFEDCITDFSRPNQGIGGK